MSRLVVILFMILSITLPAQDLDYVKQQADILAAPDMYGRGYVNNGVGLAANHIEGEFKKMGLSPVSGQYRQDFVHSVNTFPSAMKICLGRKELKAGEDFLVDPLSSPMSGKYKVNYLEPDQRYFVVGLPQVEQNEINVVDCRMTKEMRADSIDDKDQQSMLRSMQGYVRSTTTRNSAMVLTDEKFVWGGAQTRNGGAFISIHGDAFRAKGKMTIDIENEFIPEYTSTNVMGMVTGSLYPDSFIVFTAHYDHLGMMGQEACFAGANDNASGTAVMMSFAKHYAENPPECSVVFIAFAGEEIGLVGSFHFAENPLIPLEKIGFLLNLDLFASGAEGITIVNATEVPEAYALLGSINEEKDLLPLVKKRGPSANSDHHPFTLKGVPAIFIYAMGGSKAYHDIHDTPDKLTFDEYPDIFTLLTTFVDRLNK